jgi:cytochrome c
VFVSPNILLEPASPGNPQKSPEHLVARKHCTLTPHVKAADFSLSNFLSAVRKMRTDAALLRRSVLQCSVTLTQIAAKTTKPVCPPCYWVGCEACRRSPAGKAKRLSESNRKEFAMRGVIFAAVLAMTGTGGASAQDAAAGEKVFAVCKACHQIGETAKNAVGPVLNGIIGRAAGTYPGFNYSDANKNSGLTWDEATFKDYIKDPRAKIPGTKMIYAGLKDEQKTSDLLAYLKQFDADGKKK